MFQNDGSANQHPHDGSGSRALNTERRNDRSTPTIRRLDLPDTARSPYAPGRLRRASDAEALAIEAFRARHPEYDRLADAALVQAMDRYRTDDDLALREDMAGQGVDLAFDPAAGDSDEPAWSDER